MAINNFHGKLTLVSDTFNQYEIKFGDRRDLYINTLIWCIDPTDYSECVADKPICQLQITGKTETAIVPLSQFCVYRYHSAIGNIEYTGAGTLTNDIVLKLSGVVQFNPPIRLQTIESLFIGVHSIFAGTFSFKVLAGVKNVRF